MDWGTALVAVVVALIAGPIGYFSARWQARHDLAQWRRDRLLQYCSDLLAASTEILWSCWAIANGQPAPSVDEAVGRLEHAYSSVSLLSNELGIEAHKVATAYLKVLEQARTKPRDPQKQDAAEKAAAISTGIFTGMAHIVLLDLDESPSLWSLARTRIRTTGVWPHIRAAIVKALTVQQPKPVAPQVPGTPPATGTPTDPPGGTTHQP